MGIFCCFEGLFLSGILISCKMFPFLQVVLCPVFVRLPFFLHDGFLLASGKTSKCGRPSGHSAEPGGQELSVWEDIGSPVSKL